MEHKNDLPEGWGKKSGTAPAWNSENKKSSENPFSDTKKVISSDTDHSAFSKNNFTENSFSDKEKTSVQSSVDVKKQASQTIQSFPEKTHDDLPVILPETNTGNKKNSIIYILPILGAFAVTGLVLGSQYLKNFNRQTESISDMMPQDTAVSMTEESNNISIDYIATWDEYKKSGAPSETWNHVADAIDNVLQAAYALYAQNNFRESADAVNAAYYDYYETTGFERVSMGYIDGTRRTEIYEQFSAVKNLIKNSNDAENVFSELSKLSQMLHEDADILDNISDSSENNLDNIPTEPETAVIQTKIPETEETPVQTIPVTEAPTEPPTEKITEPPTEPRKPPEISCEIKAQSGQYEGYTYTLYVSGSYDYYYIDCKEYGFSDNEGYQVLSGNKSETSLYLTAGSSLDHVTASVTPYYSDGTKGETVTCTILQPEPKITSVPTPSTCFYMGTGTPVSSDGFLNLRSSKSTSSDSNIITQIPNGAVISMYWIDDDSWIYIEYGSYSGYVKESYTKLTDPQGLWADGRGEDEEVTIYSCYKTGAINGRGVAGFTTSYVVNGGAKTTVRETLGDGWHVTANSYCYAYGITWYELYDTDDGDYYGWVDSNFITFYGG